MGDLMQVHKLCIVSEKSSAMQLACCNGRPVHRSCRSPTAAGSVEAAVADAAADRADPLGQVKLIQVLAISHVQAVTTEDSL